MNRYLLCASLGTRGSKPEMRIQVLKDAQRSQRIFLQLNILRCDYECHAMLCSLRLTVHHAHIHDGHWRSRTFGPSSSEAGSDSEALSDLGTGFYCHWESTNSKGVYLCESDVSLLRVPSGVASSVLPLSGAARPPVSRPGPTSPPDGPTPRGVRRRSAGSSHSQSTP